jgi:hypothetical protein
MAVGDGVGLVGDGRRGRMIGGRGGGKASEGCVVEGERGATI